MENLVGVIFLEFSSPIVVEYGRAYKCMVCDQEFKGSAFLLC